MAIWAAVFAAVVAAFFLIRVRVQRALEGKIISTADYMFWTKWGQSPRQYKGEDYAFSKTETSQDIRAKQSEKNKYINYNVTSTISENTISSSVEEGSQPLLRTFNLNTPASVSPNVPVVETQKEPIQEEPIEQINCSKLNRAGQVCSSDGKGGCECRWVGVGGKM